MTRRTEGVVGGLIVAALAFATGACGEESGGEDATLTGTVTIIGGGGYNKSSPCHGISGGDASLGISFDYSDIAEGTHVRVLNASGDIIGTGELPPGEYKSTTPSGSDGCQFALDIPLDEDSDHYQLIVGQRPPYDFDDPSGLALVVGPQ